MRKWNCIGSGVNVCVISIVRGMLYSYMNGASPPEQKKFLNIYPTVLGLRYQIDAPSTKTTNSEVQSYEQLNEVLKTIENKKINSFFWLSQSVLPTFTRS